MTLTLHKRHGSRFEILARGSVKKRGEMNKNEARWADELTANPDVYEWWFQPTSFRISQPAEGQGSRYVPDFMVLFQDGRIAFDDVKSIGGFNNEAAFVRASACAQLYPCFVFRTVTPIAMKRGGGWEIRNV